MKTKIFTSCAPCDPCVPCVNPHIITKKKNTATATATATDLGDKISLIMRQIQSHVIRNIEKGIFPTPTETFKDFEFALIAQASEEAAVKAIGNLSPSTPQIF